MNNNNFEFAMGLQLRVRVHKGGSSCHDRSSTSTSTSEIFELQLQRDLQWLSPGFLIDSNTWRALNWNTNSNKGFKLESELKLRLWTCTLVRLWVAKSIEEIKTPNRESRWKVELQPLDSKVAISNWNLDMNWNSKSRLNSKSMVLQTWLMNSNQELDHLPGRNLHRNSNHELRSKSDQYEKSICKEFQNSKRVSSNELESRRRHFVNQEEASWIKESRSWIWE